MFIAAWPPPEVIAVLDALPREPSDGVRFSTAGQWHATLRFLGEVDPDLAAEAVAGLAFPAVEAVVGPAVERIAPGIVVAPIGGLDPVAAAVAALDVGERDDRPFRGHITLARQKRGDGCSLDGVPIQATFTVDEVALVRSELHADGARYTTVTRVAATS